MSKAFDDTLNYRQYPIIRNGLIKNAGKVFKNFKKLLVSQSNLRNALKESRNAHLARYLG